jgi:hypothetical protein
VVRFADAAHRGAVVRGQRVMLADPSYQAGNQHDGREMAATVLSRIAFVLYTVLARRFTLGPDPGRGPRVPVPRHGP